MTCTCAARTHAYNERNASLLAVHLTPSMQLRTTPNPHVHVSADLQAWVRDERLRFSSTVTTAAVHEVGVVSMTMKGMGLPLCYQMCDCVWWIIALLDVVAMR